VEDAVPKISEEKLIAIQVRLFETDLKYLRSLYGDSFGVNKAIRTIVRSFVTQSRARAAQIIDEKERHDTTQGTDTDV
jgi:hypothetical protein